MNQQYGQQQYGNPPQGFGSGFGPGHGQPGPMGYEFNLQEEERIAYVVKWCRALAIVMFVQAGLSLINFSLIQLAVEIALGISFWGAGKALQDVIDSQGNDISLMMEALTKLNQAFLIRIILTGIGIGLIAIVLLVGGVALMAS